MELFRDPDPAAFRKAFDEAQSRRNDQGDRWKPRVGEVGKPTRNIIRIAPMRPDMTDVFVALPMHYSLGPENLDGKEGGNAFACLAYWSEDCEGCKRHQWVDSNRRVQKDPGLRKVWGDVAYNIRANLRFTGALLDYTDSVALNKGWQRYSFGTDMEKKLRACFYDDAGNFRSITNPHRGRRILMDVSKKPNSTFNQYDVVRPEEQDTALHDLKLLELLPDLMVEVIRKPTAEEVYKAMTTTVQAKLAAQAGGKGGMTAGQLAPASAPVVVPPSYTLAPPPPVVAPVAAPVAAPPAVSFTPPPVVAVPPVSAPAPAPPVAPPAQVAPPAEVPAPRPTRQPVVEDPPPPVVVAPAAVVEGADLTWDQVTAIAVERGFPSGQQPFVPNQDQLAQLRRPPCFTKEWMPSEGTCARCRLFLPCGTAILKANPNAGMAKVAA